MASSPKGRRVSLDIGDVTDMHKAINALRVIIAVMSAGDVSSEEAASLLAP